MVQGCGRAVNISSSFETRAARAPQDEEQKKNPHGEERPKGASRTMRGEAGYAANNRFTRGQASVPFSSISGRYLGLNQAASASW